MCAMKGPKCPSLMKACITQLTTLLNKKNQLMEDDIQKAAMIIKEIRAQSPSSAFAYEEQLRDKVINNSIETDCLLISNKHFAKEGLRRGPSPLIQLQAY